MKGLSKLGILDIFTESGSQKYHNFLHDNRRQKGASFKCGAMFGKILKAGWIIANFSVFHKILLCESVKETVTKHFLILTPTD